MRKLRLRPLLGQGDVFHFATVSAQPGWTAEHEHDFFEFFWVVRGHGRERVNNEERRLFAGGVALVRPTDRHAFRSEKNDGLMFRNLAVLPRVRSTFFARHRGSLEDPWGPAGVPDRRVGVTERGVRRLEAMGAALQSGRRDTAALEHGLLTLALVLEDCRAEPVAGPAWLRAALADTATLREGVGAFVNACGHRHEHVARTCRAVLSRTPRELVNAARLEHAALQLAETDRSVTEVCFDAGFGNLGHFHALFKARFGATPLRWRRRQQRVLP